MTEEEEEDLRWLLNYCEGCFFGIDEGKITPNELTEAENRLFNYVDDLLERRKK